MLALSRGEGQSIIIDGQIEVKIVKWSRSSVRLAIQAPREVKVDRDEIWRRENPGKPTPLEVAEADRRDRFAREGGTPPQAPHPHASHTPHPPHPTHHSVSHAPGAAPPLPEAVLLPLKAAAPGQFFVRPSPDAPPFVHVGTSVDESTVVGLLNTANAAAPHRQEILAQTRGTVAKVLVSNGQSVEAGQSLFLLNPLPPSE